jgi:hypothetical protein
MSSPKEGIEQEIPKEFMGVDTDAVTHPWTVMIHAHDTFVADRAVMTSGRLYVIA